MQVEPDHVVSVRLILRQPSSAWLIFNLEEIKIYPHIEPVSFVFVISWQKIYTELFDNRSKSNISHKLNEIVKVE